MRRPPLTRWSDVEGCESLLFLAQRLEELLFDYTLDTYKLPALNTRSRALELQHAVREVLRGTMAEQAIRPIVEELCWSIKEDSAARVVLGNAWHFYSDVREWDARQPGDKRVHVDLLLASLQDRYLPEILRQLAEAVRANTSKSAIERLASAAVTEWIQLGFSTDFVFWRTRQFFFGRFGDPIVSLGSLEAFLEYFQRSEKPWTVVFRGSPAMREIADLVPEDVFRVHAEAPTPRTQNSYENGFLSGDHDGVWLEVPVRARDARTARIEAGRSLEVIAALIRYHAHRVILEWGGDALVYDEAGNPVLLKPSTSPLLKYPEPQVRHLSEEINRTWGVLSPNSMPRSSWLRITSATNLHLGALRTETIEAQLFGLWSALESLLPVTGTGSTMKTLTTTFGPALARRYPRKLLSDLDVSLSRNAPAAYADAIEGLGGSRLAQLARLLCLSEHQTRIDTLSASITRNPLLRYRLYQVTTRLRTPAATLATIGEHERRIEWHLHRIYRSRNLLAHSGRLLPYHDTLVENVHSYFHRIMDAVAEVMAGNPKPGSLDQAFNAISVAHKAHCNGLVHAGKSAYTSDDVEQLLLD